MPSEGGQDIPSVRLGGNRGCHKAAGLAPSRASSYEPCVAIILQGAKKITFGEEACEFRQRAFFVTSVEIPTLARVTVTSEENPIYPSY